MFLWCAVCERVGGHDRSRGIPERKSRGHQNKAHVARERSTFPSVDTCESARAASCANGPKIKARENTDVNQGDTNEQRKRFVFAFRNAPSKIALLIASLFVNRTQYQLTVAVA